MDKVQGPGFIRGCIMIMIIVLVIGLLEWGLGFPVLGRV